MFSFTYCLSDIVPMAQYNLIRQRLLYILQIWWVLNILTWPCRWGLPHPMLSLTWSGSLQRCPTGTSAVSRSRSTSEPPTCRSDISKHGETFWREKNERVSFSVFVNFCKLMRRPQFCEKATLDNETESESWLQIVSHTPEDLRGQFDDVLCWRTISKCFIAIIDSVNFENVFHSLL